MRRSTRALSGIGYALLLSAANVAACAALLLCVAVMVFQLH